MAIPLWLNIHFKPRGCACGCAVLRSAAGLLLILASVSADVGEAMGDEPAPARLERFEAQQIQMGVPFRIVVYAPDAESAGAATKAAFRRIKELNSVLSDYDPDSELRRLCASAVPGEPQSVSPELYDVLSRSLQISQSSEGAFDITVGPAVKLWRIARRRKVLPAAEELQLALARIGYQNVSLNPATRQVVLKRADLLLDLGGIAKGYAAGEALKVLQRHGLSRALVDGSGDIVVGEPPPGRDGWTIEVAALKSGDGDENRLLTLSNAAVATSGDAYQSVEIDGRRFSHIVDPKTGLGLTRSSSVTVIARDGATADALASALSVMEPQAGLRLIERTAGASARIVHLQDGMLQVWSSPDLERKLERGGPPSP